MSTVVVYESMFGNTEKVARAVAAGIRSELGVPAPEVTVVEVSAAPDRLGHGVGLVVAGGPTHAFGMTRPSTRDEARRSAGEAAVSHGIGLRDWIESFGTEDPELLTATFDTRVDKVRRLPGSAAKGAAKVLRRRGFRAVVPPQSFYVSDTEGPLDDGELEHARRWGEQLGRLYRDAQAGLRR